MDFKLDENLVIRPEADLVLVFGYTSASDYAYLLLSAKAGESGVYQVSQGQVQQVHAITPAAVTTHGWHSARLTRTAQTLSVEVNGSALFQLGLSGLTLPVQGRVGIGSRDDAVFFDNITVSGTSNAVANTGWQAFQQQHFSTAPTSMRAAPGWDFEGDGRINGVEYVEASNPTLIEVLDSPLQFRLDQGQPMVEYRRPLSLSDVTSHLWSSEDLQTWTPASATPSHVEQGEQVYQYPVPGGTPSFFTLRYGFPQP